jgi:hypothetical protein
MGTPRCRSANPTGPKELQARFYLLNDEDHSRRYNPIVA